MKLLEQLINEVERKGYITCRACGTAIDHDTEKCPDCGWINPLAKLV
jgi:rubrerythrin